MRRCLVLFLALLMTLSACTQRSIDHVSFSKGEPHSSLDFRQYFETMSTKYGPCTVNIQSDIFDSKSAQHLFSSITEDLHSISKTTGITVDDFSPFTIYIVESAPIGVERYDNLLYCTAEDVENRNYLADLACVALNIKEYWKAFGLESCILGRKADDTLLKSIFEKTNDLDILSLFISYFTKPFANNDEIQLAQQTATAVTRYILEKYGGKALLEEDCIIYKQEWLKSIGVDRPYSDPLHDDLRSYTFRRSAQYPLIAVNDHDHRFYILQLSDMKTAKAVRRFLYDAAVGPQKVLQFITEQAPEHYERIKERYEGKLDIYCSTTSGGSANPGLRRIQLQQSYGYLHELGHILVPTLQSGKGLDPVWQYEGLCEYLSYMIYPANSLLHSYYEDALVLYSKTGSDPGEGKSNNPANRAFWARVTEIYLKNAPLPNDAESIDLPLFISSMAEARVRYPEELKESIWVIPINSLHPLIDGNDLTYAQAFCFSRYLIEQYSFSKYLDYCSNLYTFEEAFSKPYSELMTEYENKIYSTN